MEKLIGAGIAVVGGVAAAKALDKKHNISTDLRLAKTFVRIRMKTSKMESTNLTVADVVEDTVDRLKSKTAILFVNDGTKVTFGDLDAAANRLANWCLAQGLRAGDVVALMMQNRPEFIVVWLAMAKLGIVTAFLNFNLRGAPLMHCVRVSKAKMLVFDEDLREAVEAVRPEFAALELATPLVTAAYSGIKPFAGAGLDVDLAKILPSQNASRPPRAQRAAVKPSQPFALVYTSGTTGMPKAANISHLRMVLAAMGFYSMFNLREDDVVYTVLPLYHSAGGMIGAGLCVVQGCTMILRDKFSLSRFWEDVRDYKATVMQYIGELCRYLLLGKPNPAEKEHRLRIAIGNGLRPDIWAEFQTRFNIPEVGEFYGATEGNVLLANHCTTPETRGAVGIMGTIFKLLKMNVIVKFNDETEEVVRGPDGFCIQCGPGEPGEMIGLINENDPTRRFQGYHGNERATQQKIIHDVFKKGDSYFRTGDLLKRDADGRVHFVDRIGDTFRWKGENVATTEVAEVVSQFPGVAEANVYGVSVAGKDGRAGMAAITLKEGLNPPGTPGGSTFDVAGLAKHCVKNLPSYAVPVFLRFLPEVPITGTFKHQKVQLRKEGCDPTVIPDPLFWLNPDNKTYEPLNAQAYMKLAMVAKL